MLSEARARLANTQGKKAKRKARERQLEEARRLAVLQKKRELKAAGIMYAISLLFTCAISPYFSMRHKTKLKGMDVGHFCYPSVGFLLNTFSQYNADIPFEKRPAPGFYDTSEEQARITSAPIGQSLRRLENKRRSDDEEAERRKRQRRNEKEGQGPGHQTKFIPARDAQIQKLKEADSIGRRRKLVLPNAQVGEGELEEIVKIGQTGENAKALVSGGSEATSKLLGEYEGLESARMARTPRTAPQREFDLHWIQCRTYLTCSCFQEDNVMAEARNLRNMTIAQTPLLGDENTPLHPADGGTGFEGATPRHQVAFTPNPLATPLHGGAIDGNSAVGATPLRTPVRDNLSINPTTGMVTGGETPREQRLRVDSAKRALKAGFLNLPKPENNFELLVPEDEEEESEQAPAVEEDAAERDARLKRMREEEERKALARRSQVVQRGLPRPARVDIEQLLYNLNLGEEDELTDARKLIHAEISSLVLHDSIAHPIPGTNLPGGSISSYILPPDEDLALAKSMVHLELATSIGFPAATEAQIKDGLQMLSKNEEVDEAVSWAYDRQRLALNPHTKTWVDPDSLSLDDRISGYTILLEECREQMTKEASKTARLEKKLGITLGGYQDRSKKLAERLTNAFDELVRTKLDYESFARLATNEAAAGPRRVETLKEEVEVLARRERLLQERYAELERERRDTESRVAALEEQVMAEAEALNEAALAEMEASA